MMLMFKTTEDQLLFMSVAGECTYTALISLSVMCVCVKFSQVMFIPIHFCIALEAERVHLYLH